MGGGKKQIVLRKNVNWKQIGKEAKSGKKKGQTETTKRVQRETVKPRNTKALRPLKITVHNFQ